MGRERAPLGYNHSLSSENDLQISLQLCAPGEGKKTQLSYANSDHGSTEQLLKKKKNVSPVCLTDLNGNAVHQSLCLTVLFLQSNTLLHTQLYHNKE